MAWLERLTAGLVCCQSSALFGTHVSLGGFFPLGKGHIHRSRADKPGKTFAKALIATSTKAHPSCSCQLPACPSCFGRSSFSVQQSGRPEAANTVCLGQSLFCWLYIVSGGPENGHRSPTIGVRAQRGPLCVSEVDNTDRAQNRPVCLQGVG